jgi:uncharacterized protein (DUF2461 family)
VETVRIECLGCGEARAVPAAAPGKQLHPGECHRCSYVGWAPSAALSEPMRRRIRERPVDRRAVVYVL